MKPNNPSPNLSRRTFLQTLAAASLASGCVNPSAEVSKPPGIAQRYSGLDQDDYLGEVRIETKLTVPEVFTEGPAVNRAGEVFFTNIPANKILKWNPKTRRLTSFRENSNATNGLLFDHSGDLLACEGGAGRITRTNMTTGEVSIVASEFNGFPFAAPNDLALDGEGRLYFSSRPGVTDPSKGNPTAVYRVDPNGRVTQLLRWPEVHMPNGLVVSPDDRTLYLIEAHPDADHYRNIRAFDLREGNLSNRRTLIDFYPGRSGDGMCIDEEGNLYVAAGLHQTRDTSETLDTRPGIHLISPQGELLAFARTPEDTVTNCTFGGDDLRTLYVTCGRYLLSIRTRIPGKPVS